MSNSRDNSNFEIFASKTKEQLIARAEGQSGVRKYPENYQCERRAFATNGCNQSEAGPLY